MLDVLVIGDNAFTPFVSIDSAHLDPRPRSYQKRYQVLFTTYNSGTPKKEQVQVKVEIRHDLNFIKKCDSVPVQIT